MNLTDDQKQLVAQWVKEGCGLSEVQRRMTDQFKLSLTYMDVRFLIIELGLEIREKPETRSAPKPVDPAPLPKPTEEDMAGMPGFEDIPAPAASGVTVEVDRLIRPGALVSGSVVFSDGVKATWALDQAGRLSLGATDKSYRPSAQDIQDFQMSIARELKKLGYA